MDKLNAAIKTINANINIPADGKQFRRVETNIRVKNTGNVGINRMYYDVMILMKIIKKFILIQKISKVKFPVVAKKI